MMQRVYTHLLRHSRTQRCPCRSVTSQVPRTAPLKKPFWKDANNYLLICPITCVGLAIWQVKRKEWKENLIDTIKERYEMDPIQLPKDLSTVKDFDLYPVKVRGHFDYANEVYIGPRSDTPERRHQTLGGKVSGVYVITPFKLADRDESILVNRGWIENDYFALEENRKNAQVQGEQEIVGILRKDQDTSSYFWKFLLDFEKPEKKADCDVYYVRKIEQLAERCGTAPVYIDSKTERKSLDEPKPIQVGVELRNEHLSYIFTWATLAVITFYLWYKKVNPSGKTTSVNAFIKSQESRRVGGN